MRFQSNAMWVEGQGGIYKDQFIRYTYDSEMLEQYNYISYKSKQGEVKEALFLFANSKAQRNFLKAYLRWEALEPQPRPNYR